ncbi:squamous cell carcinoma antigen recognized by T-cells 3 isoform X2 [Carica papaya]|uniref:squamous cell carcinoma antigen recognized by T-cells 3 isoform X2 n=1 Tax=Carica papaya TaxID=3649 RepID=UPI000B8CC363|nr:squamous cell carcinoma antigen recognized by T-cells 3 isoform X2 [Carica papaya]
MEDQNLTEESLAPISPQLRENIHNDDEQRTESSDSDDDSSESDDDELQISSQLQTLEDELSINPSNYDAHVQYIKILRKMSELEKLREAREAMSALFPLSPAMWQEWTKDEASLSTRPEALSAIEKLYERGLSDYLSVSLWCDYLNFVQEYDPSVRDCLPDGISKARNLFERAVTAAGLHVTEGSKIWEAYREFEQAICPAIGEVDFEGREKQVQRIRNLFHRQLSVPLANLRSLLLGYKAWEVEQGSKLDSESSNVDGIPSHIASAYQKALDMFHARIHLEEQISKKDISDTEKFQQFMDYLIFEQSFGDPVRVQVLYERAVTEFPISSDLWLEYTRYLDRTLKAGKIVTDIYSRAIKNCPWVGELWVRYLLSLERGHASEKEISAVFEKSLQCSFSTHEEYLDLFLTRVDGLRRRISSASEGNVTLDYSLIRGTFEQASDYLSPHMKNTDGLLCLHAYWARLELKFGKDLGAARGVWERLLKNCGSMLEAWQGYIAMEKELDHINEARSIYRRCYSKRFAGMGSENHSGHMQCLAAL